MIDFVVPIITGIASIIGLIICYLSNNKILSKGNNLIYFLAIWFLFTIVLLFASLIPERSEEITSLLYPIAGVSLPQIGILWMKINDFNEEIRKFTEKIKKLEKDHNDKIEKLEKDHNTELQRLLGCIKDHLYTTDVPLVSEYISANKNFNEIMGIFLQKANDYVNKGIMSPEDKDAYLKSLEYVYHSLTGS